MDAGPGAMSRWRRRLEVEMNVEVGKEVEVGASKRSHSLWKLTGSMW